MAAELRLHGSAAEGGAAEVVPPPPGYVEYTKSKGCDCCEPVKIKTKNKKGLRRFIGMMNAHGGEMNEGNDAGEAPSLPQSPTLVAEHLRGEADGDPKGDGGDGGDGAPVTERVKRWEGGRGKPRPKHSGTVAGLTETTTVPPAVEQITEQVPTASPNGSARKRVAASQCGGRQGARSWGPPEISLATPDEKDENAGDFGISAEQVEQDLGGQTAREAEPGDFGIGSAPIQHDFGMGAAHAPEPEQVSATSTRPSDFQQPPRPKTAAPAPEDGDGGDDDDDENRELEEIAEREAADRHRKEELIKAKRDRELRAQRDGQAHAQAAQELPGPDPIKRSGPEAQPKNIQVGLRPGETHREYMRDWYGTIIGMLRLARMYHKTIKTVFTPDLFRIKYSADDFCKHVPQTLK